MIVYFLTIVLGVLGLQVSGFQSCQDGVAQLVEECPQIDQLTKIAEDLLARSIVSEKEFPASCCEVIAELNEAECFCEEDLVQQFSKVAGEEFLPSLLFQASQVEPAGCSVKVMAAVDGDVCQAFGNQVFTEDLAKYQAECTEDNLIGDVLSETKGLQFLKEAIDMLDLQPQLDLFPSVTLFAPTDAAFESWAQNEGILPEDLFADSELLVTILARHIVVNSTIIPENIKDPEPFKTLQGSNLNLTPNMLDLNLKSSKNSQNSQNQLLVQGFEMQMPGSIACNGVIYKIDTVLWPEDKTAADVTPTPTPTTTPTPAATPTPNSTPNPIPVGPSSSGNAIFDLEALLNEFPESEDDFEGVGVGVSFAKSMDSVDEPCNINVFQLTTQFLPLFSQYLEYAEAQGLQDILEKGTGITITIPINTAFAGKSEEEIRQNWNPLNHIVMEELTLEQLGQLNKPLVTLGGSVTVTTRPSGKVVVGGAEVVQSDVVGCNGRLQVVGQLIMNSQVTPIAPQYPLDPMDMSNNNQNNINNGQVKLVQPPTPEMPVPSEEAGPMTQQQINQNSQNILENKAPQPEDNETMVSDAPVPTVIRTPRPTAVITPTIDPTAPKNSEILSQAITLANDTINSTPPEQYIRPVRPSVPAPTIQMPSPQIFNEPSPSGPSLPFQPPAVFVYQSPSTVRSPSQLSDPPIISAPKEYEGVDTPTTSPTPTPTPSITPGSTPTPTPSSTPSSTPTPIVTPPITTGPYEAQPKPGLLTPITQVIQDGFVPLDQSPAIVVPDYDSYNSDSSPALDVTQFIQSGDQLSPDVVVDQSSPPSPPCACSADGNSGGVNTGSIGCQEFVEGWPSFCYVVNPYGCFLSKPSQKFLGARWRNCTIVEDDVGGAKETQFDVLQQVADSTVEEVQQQQEQQQTGSVSPPAVNGNSGPCSCSPTGTSGTVQTGRPGCVEHIPGYSPFCYVLDPVNCFVARESSRYPSAGWRYCAIPSQDEQNKPSKPDNVVRVSILPVLDPTTGEQKFRMFLSSKDD